ncbi:hypothetical protein Tco_0748571 [Tanacetum coccineum]|uniref:Reverse transcriptase domain-containing protein n=1 Tax=Tanacetum coccineum TaxID=301880 RepID=A0ABQ4YYR5_9ASTR
MEPLDALLMGDEVISTTLARENTEFIKSSVDDLVPIPRESEVTSVCNDLECTDDHVPIPRMFEKPLGNLDMMSRSVETSDFILEEISAEIGLDDSISMKIDDGDYDSEGDILYLEQLLNEDIISDLSPALLPKESSLLVLRLPDFKQICLKEVERFDPFSP